MPPRYGGLCPDWIEWAGILENVFSLSLQAEERYGLLTKHSVTVITAGIQIQIQLVYMEICLIATSEYV